MALEILHRPRRGRRSESIRRLVRETVLRPEDLIWPLFIHDSKEDVVIESMPGVSRLGEDSLMRACERAMELRIPAVAVFPSIDPALKNPIGCHAFEASNILYRAVSE
ncbi:MAG: porphobilinogen synthase, partial [Spartobacteria bacterium]